MALPVSLRVDRVTGLTLRSPAAADGGRHRLCYVFLRIHRDGLRSPATADGGRQEQRFRVALAEVSPVAIPGHRDGGR